MEVQFQLRVPGQVLEATLGWPPSDGADVTMLGSGDSGLIEVLDVPEHLRTSSLPVLLHGDFSDGWMPPAFFHAARA